MFLKCLATSSKSNGYISSVIQNEQITFTLPKNIIADFSLARVLCVVHCMMNKSLNPLFTLHASAACYRSTATGADPPHLGKFLKRLSVRHH